MSVFHVTFFTMATLVSVSPQLFSLSCCFVFNTKTSPPVLARSALSCELCLLYDSHPSFGKYYVHFMERARGRSAATTGDNAVLQAAFVKRNNTDASLL